MSLTKQNRTSSASNAVKSLAMTPIQRTVTHYLKLANAGAAVRAFTIGSNVTLLPAPLGNSTQFNSIQLNSTQFNSIQPSGQRLRCGRETAIGSQPRLAIQPFFLKLVSITISNPRTIISSGKLGAPFATTCSGR
jgi:hypothetical protein